MPEYFSKKNNDSLEKMKIWCRLYRTRIFTVVGESESHE